MLDFKAYVDKEYSTFGYSHLRRNDFHYKLHELETIDTDYKFGGKLKLNMHVYNLFTCKIW